MKMKIVWILGFVAAVNAHFTLHGSREQAMYSHNERFWPIRGGNTLRGIKDCLQMPPTTPRSMTPGSSVTLPFEIGGGAAHVGLCTAELVDSATGQATPIGQENNCVSRNQAMTVQIPSSVPCSNCVIKVRVHATHVPTTPEDYDSCLDVTFGQGSTQPIPTPVPEIPSPKTPVPPTQQSPKIPPPFQLPPGPKTPPKIPPPFQGTVPPFSHGQPPFGNQNSVPGCVCPTF